MSKRELERRIWAVLQAEGKVPNSTTAEGHAAYMKLKRDVEKQVARQNFFQFILHYDVVWGDVKRMLLTDISFEPKKKRR